jgi:DNA-binding LacI/PurR family transcriptional regulator
VAVSTRNGEKQAPTLEAVARLAGVSRATASRVITGSPRVSPEARQAVTRAASKLGYVPNRAARSLVTRRSDSVGLVIPEPTAFMFGDPFFPRLVRGIGEELSHRGQQLVLFTPQSSADESRLAQYLEQHVDGVLLVSLHGLDPLPARLRRRDVPVVLGGRPANDLPVSYVDVDNVGGAALAVQHLLEQGRQVATITGPLDMVAGIDRREGYRKAHQAAGRPLDPDLEEPGDFTQEGGARAMEALLARRPSLTAVFVASDLMALGALRVLRAAGRRVPDDVALVGFDDSPLAAGAEPALSSVRQPVEEMGREMARLLVRSLGSRDHVARRVILATELVRRRSSEGVVGSDT